MMNKELVRTSKFLSLVLRHRPERLDLTLEAGGWVPVDALLAAAKRAGVPLDNALLQDVVAQNDKKRFAFSEDGLRIRANQGHSVPIDLGLEPTAPPERLFHGTALRFLGSIRQQGLLRKKRHHVHLSPDVDTATAVGKRHGKPVVLTIKAQQMHEAGVLFYQSKNNVWLTEHVAPGYLIFPEGHV